MIYRHLYAPLITAVLVGGCVVRAPIGQDTPRPWDTPGVQLGSSTVADVMAAFGEPTRRTENAVSQPSNPAQAATFHPYDDITLVYENGDRVTASYPLLRQVRLRTTTFRFHNKVLTGYAFASAFPEDARTIDFDRVEPLLHSDTTTPADLIAAIGPPQSRQTQATVVVPATTSLPPSRHPTPATPAVTMNQVTGEFDNWTSTVSGADGRIARTERLNVTFGPGNHLLRFSRNTTSPTQ